MTANYPMGDACRDVVASGATLRGRTASLGNPVNVAGPSWGSHRRMASCTSVFTGHPRLQRGSGIPRQLPRIPSANSREASANPLRSWAVAASRRVSSSNRLQLGQ